MKRLCRNDLEDRIELLGARRTAIEKDISSGRLSLEGYVAASEAQATFDQQLAVVLREQGRTMEAAAVYSRVKAIRAALEQLVKAVRVGNKRVESMESVTKCVGFEVNSPAAWKVVK